MLLSDTDIRMHLRSTAEDLRLVIEPLNQQDIQPASIDLHLGPHLLVSRPGWPEFQEYDLEKDGPVWVRPGWFVLGETLEWIEIPPTLSGEMIGKSSRAREGWVVEAAGYFDPGWKGVGTLELSMRHHNGRYLERGMAICQMRFHVLSSKPQFLYGSKEVQSHYQGSKTVEPSWTDPLPLPTRARPDESLVHNLE